MKRAQAYRCKRKTNLGRVCSPIIDRVRVSCLLKVCPADGLPVKLEAPTSQLFLLITARLTLLFAGVPPRWLLGPAFLASTHSLDCSAAKCHFEGDVLQV